MKISKGKVERIALWVSIGVLFTGLIVSIILVAGELNAINAMLAERVPSADVGDGSLDVGEPISMDKTRPQVGIAGARTISDTLAMTVTVRFAGAGDLLYEAPEVVSQSGRTYPVTGDSLEQARFAFLDLVTGGQATAQFRFAGRPSLAGGDALTLVFNPNQNASDGYSIAPRVEVPVPLVTE